MLLWVALAVGCHRQEDGVKDAVRQQAGDSALPSSPRGPLPGAVVATNGTVIAATGDVNAVLQQLTQELRDYVVRTRSVPKTFDEFASKSQVRFPAPPEGKQYALQGQAVVLVKR